LKVNVGHSYTHCRFGVATRDVTPPVGIYHRTWGAAAHDAAEGIHRPFAATAAAFAPLDAGGPTLALVAVDIGWFQYGRDERALRATIMERTGLDESALLINMSHTHAGANVNSQLLDKPGFELIEPYLADLTGWIADAVAEAMASLEPAWVTYGHGRCSLATNRDLWDPEAGRFACGYNPDVPADDTLLVARVTGDAGDLRATLFNYACHPTTLAWQNKLLSPDFIGAARAVLEDTYSVPALFLQGASGELAPRDDYVGETEIADRNGRQLGFAAAAAIEGLPPAGTQFVYTGIVGSGANLGTWEYQPCDARQLTASGELQARQITVPLVRKEIPTVVESVSDATPEAVQEKEKALRRQFLALELGDGPVYEMSMWLWRLGDALLVAVPNECYSVFQVELRQRFAGTPVLVLNMTNGTLGYLPPHENYGNGTYQEQQSPFAPGCLEQSLEAAAEALGELV
jgi:hypothetical protein